MRELDIDGYKSYSQMNEAEKRAVDDYANGLRAQGAMLSDDKFNHLINMGIINPEHLGRLNEAMDRMEMDRNDRANELRYQMFQDRLKNGFYDERPMPRNTPQAPVNVNINNSDSQEVRDLKNEVSSLKNDINELKSILLEKMK